MSILDLFYPKRCVGCKKRGTYLCSSCLSSVKPHLPQVCPICEKRAIDGLIHPGCKRATSPDGLFALWAYEESIRKLITKLKYKYVSDIAQLLGVEAVKVIKKSPILVKVKFTIVPIPLYWTRQNWRGFNQAEEIGKIIKEEMGWEMGNLLIRKKSTKSQVSLTEKERRQNVAGVFALNPQYSKFKIPDSILLFDDVWTTGATMLEATKILKKAGAKHIWCLTLARRV